MEAPDLLGGLTAWSGFENAGAGGRGVDKVNSMPDSDGRDGEIAGAERGFGLVGERTAGRYGVQDGDGSGPSEGCDIVGKGDRAQVQNRGSAGDEDEVSGSSRNQGGLLSVRSGVDDSELGAVFAGGREGVLEVGGPCRDNDGNFGFASLAPL